MFVFLLPCYWLLNPAAVVLVRRPLRNRRRDDGAPDPDSTVRPASKQLVRQSREGASVAAGHVTLVPRSGARWVTNWEHVVRSHMIRKLMKRSLCLHRVKAGGSKHKFLSHEVKMKNLLSWPCLCLCLIIHLAALVDCAPNENEIISK